MQGDRSTGRLRRSGGNSRVRAWTRVGIRGRLIRKEGNRFIVAVGAIATNVESALHQVAAIGLYRIAIRCCVRRDPGGGIAMRLVRRSRLLRPRRAMRTFVLGNCGDGTGLQRKTDPHSGEQAEQSGPGALLVPVGGFPEHGLYALILPCVSQFLSCNCPQYCSGGPSSMTFFAFLACQGQ